MNQGRIITYADAAHAGVIQTSEGRLIIFSDADWREKGEPLPGEFVAFDSDFQHATNVKRISARDRNRAGTSSVGLLCRKSDKAA